LKTAGFYYFYTAESYYELSKTPFSSQTGFNSDFDYRNWISHQFRPEYFGAFLFGILNGNAFFADCYFYGNKAPLSQIFIYNSFCNVSLSCSYRNDLFFQYTAFKFQQRCSASYQAVPSGFS